MIKNEKQYKITKKKLAEIRGDIEQIQSQNDPLALEDRLILASLLHLSEEMENEIVAYDDLKTTSSSFLRERSIDDLPEMLIEYKILSGMTQKEFSEKIGIKEQQLQRYESENFKSISFKNLLKILHAIGLEVSIKGGSLNNLIQNQSHNNQSIA